MQKLVGGLVGTCVHVSEWVGGCLCAREWVGWWVPVCMWVGGLVGACVHVSEWVCGCLCAREWVGLWVPVCMWVSGFVGASVSEGRRERTGKEGGREGKMEGQKRTFFNIWSNIMNYNECNMILWNTTVQGRKRTSFNIQFNTMRVIWLFWKTTVQNYLEKILVVASPKSPILTWSFESRKIFTGFRSRWIMPCWWMWARPSTISLNNRHTLWLSSNNPLSIAVLQQSKVPCYMMCHKQPPFTITMGIVTGRLQSILKYTHISVVEYSGTWLKSQIKIDIITEVSVVYFSLPRNMQR